MRKSGFTLIEVMIVVAIIAVLSAIVIPVYSSYQSVTKRNACFANVKMLDRATEAYIIHKNLANDAEVTVSMLAPEGGGSDIKADFFIRYKPTCPSDGEYKYTPEKQSWSCTVCGNGVD